MHTTHECQICGAIWLCDGRKPSTEATCIRPRMWPCIACWMHRCAVIDATGICPTCRTVVGRLAMACTNPECLFSLAGVLKAVRDR